MRLPFVVALSLLGQTRLAQVHRCRQVVVGGLDGLLVISPPWRSSAARWRCRLFCRPRFWALMSAPGMPLTGRLRQIFGGVLQIARLQATDTRIWCLARLPELGVSSITSGSRRRWRRLRVRADNPDSAPPNGTEPRRSTRRLWWREGYDQCAVSENKGCKNQQSQKIYAMLRPFSRRKAQSVHCFIAEGLLLGFTCCSFAI